MKMSVVVLFWFFLWSLSGVFCESVSVTEGDSVTLSVNLTERQMKEEISWKFGHKDVTIAETEKKGKFAKLHEERADGRFKDRLELNLHTGSLTIKNIRTQHSGLYKLINTNTEKQLDIFNITVYAHLPVPVITRDSSSSSSSSYCSVLCSVMNVSHDVSLSWYKGISLLSSISVSEQKNIISLHLECLDDSYTCVLNNSITNQTQHLNTDDCHKCEDIVADVSDNYTCTCTFTELVIRLVVSALVGVAAVAVLVYDIGCRKSEQKKSKQMKRRSEQKVMGSDIPLNASESAVINSDSAYRLPV